MNPPTPWQALDRDTRRRLLLTPMSSLTEEEQAFVEAHCPTPTTEEIEAALRQGQRDAQAAARLNKAHSSFRKPY